MPSLDMIKTTVLLMRKGKSNKISFHCKIKRSDFRLLSKLVYCSFFLRKMVIIFVERLYSLSQFAVFFTIHQFLFQAVLCFVEVEHFYCSSAHGALYLEIILRTPILNNAFSYRKIKIIKGSQYMKIPQNPWKHPAMTSNSMELRQIQHICWSLNLLSLQLSKFSVSLSRRLTFMSIFLMNAILLFINRRKVRFRILYMVFITLFLINVYRFTKNRTIMINTKKQTSLFMPATMCSGRRQRRQEVEFD